MTDAIIQYQVVFTKTDAILLENSFRPIKGKYTVLVNPYMNVDRNPSKYWKMGQNNSVVVMNDKEKLDRDRYISRYGIDDDEIFLPIKEQGKPIDSPQINSSAPLSSNKSVEASVTKNVAIDLHTGLILGLVIVDILLHLYTVLHK